MNCYKGDLLVSHLSDRIHSWMSERVTEKYRSSDFEVYFDTLNNSENSPKDKERLQSLKLKVI